MLRFLMGVALVLFIGAGSTLAYLHQPYAIRLVLEGEQHSPGWSVPASSVLLLPAQPVAPAPAPAAEAVPVTAAPAPVQAPAHARIAPARKKKPSKAVAALKKWSK